jgi:peptidoglycan/LPS O-acetylase OafA/YrhL
MANLLSTYTASRDNNFNLVRFMAASLVLFSHSFALALGSGDAEPLRSTIGMTWGTIAVDVFFITSGFLITKSYLSSNNIIAFWWARILRIYPALIVAILFCVFCVGTWFTTNSLNEYLQDPQTYKYLIKNSTLFFGIEFDLPGVFMNTPYKEAVNGSLWTLPYEVKMYVILAFTLGLAVRISRWVKFASIRNTILFIAILSTSIHIANHFQPILSIKSTRLFSLFFVGAVFYLCRDKIYLSTKWTLFLLPLLLVSSVNKDVFFVIYSLSLPFIIFYISYVPAGEIRKFNKFGDYSYGIYIYAFPVQQSIAATLPNVSVPVMIALSFLITFLLSMLSWHLIEKRFLKMKDSYVFIGTFVRYIGLKTRLLRAKNH